MRPDQTRQHAAGESLFLLTITSVARRGGARRIQDLHEASGFLVFGTSYSKLCKLLSGCPGVVFDKRRRFFWSAQDIRAEFSFQGQSFGLTIDPWDDALWIMPKDKSSPHQIIQELKDYLNTFWLPK